VAYSINWLTKVVTVPLSDLTLISGTSYSMNVDFAHDEIRRLEWEFADGLWAEHAIEYINSQVLSGLVYSPIVKMVNGYTWFVDTTDIVVSLLGSNTNFLDTFIPGLGVSVLANNSAGKIISGSGLSPEQDATLTAIDDNVIIVDGKVDVIDTNVDLLLTNVSIIDSNIDEMVLDLVSIEAKVDLLQVDTTDIWKAHFHRRTWNTIDLIQIYQADGLTPWKAFDTNADLSDINPQ